MNDVRKSIRLRTLCFENKTLNFIVRLNFKLHYERSFNNIYLNEPF